MLKHLHVFQHLHMTAVFVRAEIEVYLKNLLPGLWNIKGTIANMVLVYSEMAHVDPC